MVKHVSCDYAKHSKYFTLAVTTVNVYDYLVLNQSTCQCEIFSRFNDNHLVNVQLSGSQKWKVLSSLQQQQL